MRGSADPGQSGLDRPPWLDERLFPFRSRFLELGGCRVHYIDEGNGSPLLLLYGNPTWSFLYRDIVKGLQNRFRCVALDYLGFGLSTARAGYTFTPGAGHFIQEDAADEIVEVITRWA